MSPIADQKYQGHKAGIYQLIRKDDRHFYSCAGDGYIVEWLVDGNNPDGRLAASVEGQIFSICLVSEDLLLAGDMNGHVFWIDIGNNRVLHNFAVHQKGVFAISHDGSYCYTGGGKGCLIKWDINKRYPMETIQVSSQAIRSLIPGAGKRLYAGCSDKNIYQVNTETMMVENLVEAAHDPSVFSLLKTKQYLYSGGRDAQINQYELKTGSLVKRVAAHWFTVNDLIEIENLGLIASASRDKRIRIWEEGSLDLCWSLDVQQGGHVNSVNSLLYFPEYNYLLSASDDRTITRFKL